MTQMDIYHRIFIVALVLTIVLLVLTIVFFFVFDIPKVIGIKTGHIQKKSVENMRSGQYSKNAKKTSEMVVKVEEITGSEQTAKLETAKLEDVGELTTVLQQNVIKGDFRVITEIMEIHSQEII